MSAHFSSHLPTDVLEQRAAEQRRRIQESMGELKSSLREQLDMENYLREHIWQFLPAVSLLGLTFGYGVAGMFSRR